MSKAVSVSDKEKDAFFVVRKGDIIGIYKDLSDCQAQVGSSVYDSPVSFYKGYSFPKDAEEYISSVGLKKPLYSFRASELKEDMFGALTPCLFQVPTSCKVKVSEEEDTSEMKPLDKTKDNKKDQLPSASMSVGALEKLAKLKPSADTSDETCIIEFDGASKGNPGLSGAAAVLKTEDGSLICKMRQGLGIATNNAAEYHGLILGLKHAIKKGYTKIKVKSDSKLVCMQMKGQWKVNHEVLSKLHKEAKKLSNKCVSFEISHVLRAWNHDFFWESIQPGGGGKPTGDLLRLIERDFGSFEEFLERFKSAAASNFGSGWTWLAYKANRLDVANAVNPLPKEEDKKLVIVKTPNAVNPLVWDYSPLLTIDTWEHAYYLDFENRRAEYINTFMEKLVSWETVSTRLESAIARAVQREQEGTDTEDEENPDEEEPEVYLDSDIDVSEVD